MGPAPAERSFDAMVESGGRWGSLKPVTCATNAKATYSWKATLSKGSYTVKVYATDIAGNAQSKVGSAKLTIK